MTVDIERLAHVYPPRRQFAYVIVRETGQLRLVQGI
jgi:hypothetical protein